MIINPKHLGGRYVGEQDGVLAWTLLVLVSNDAVSEVFLMFRLMLKGLDGRHKS